MPKSIGSRRTKRVPKHDQFMHESCMSAPISRKNKKIAKSAKVEEHTSRAQPIDQHFLDCFVALISKVNTEFSKNHDLFGKTTIMKPIAGVTHSNKKMEVTNLETILECPVLVEEDKIKKEKEDTEIAGDGDGEKVW